LDKYTKLELVYMLAEVVEVAVAAWYESQSFTGLPKSDCLRISEAAEELVYAVFRPDLLKDE